jgi:hypothetical protein
MKTHTPSFKIPIAQAVCGCVLPLFEKWKLLVKLTEACIWYEEKAIYLNGIPLFLPFCHKYRCCWQEFCSHLFFSALHTSCNHCGSFAYYSSIFKMLQSVCLMVIAVMMVAQARHVCYQGNTLFIFISKRFSQSTAPFQHTVLYQYSQLYYFCTASGCRVQFVSDPDSGVRGHGRELHR